MEETLSHLPESPVKDIYSCPNCDRVHVKFWDEKSDRTFSSKEWKFIVEQGAAELDKIKAKFKDDPKIF